MSEANVVHLRVDAIRRLTRRRATAPLTKTLATSSAEDVAEALTHLTRPDSVFLFQLIPERLAGLVLLTVNEDSLGLIVQSVSFERLLRWLDAMEHDDVVDLMERLPQELRERLLERMDTIDRAQVEELLAWPPDSAGGIMSPVAFRLNEATTCREAISALQEQGDVEMVFYLYVENDAGQLVGVTSLRNLLLNPPSKTLGEIMATEVVAVSPNTDQEDVARLATRYSFLAIPVLDDTRHLLGIVTIDDVIDVVHEEAAEDMLKMAGVGDEYDPQSARSLHMLRQRMPWLIVTLISGLLLSEFIGYFQGTLQREAILAGFIPVVMGMGGNVGIQAATITVRNLATGYAGGSSPGLLIFREGRVGLGIGLSMAAMLSLYCFFRFYPQWHLGAAVGLSILIAVTVAALLGAIIPLSLARFGVDPAVATGPFVTSAIDFTGIVVYFFICTIAFGF